MRKTMQRKKKKKRNIVRNIMQKKKKKRKFLDKTQRPPRDMFKRTTLKN